MFSPTEKHQANFFISLRVLAVLKETIPVRERSEFVEQAIRKELQAKRFREALKTAAGAWKRKNHSENTAQFIRSIRESRRS